MARTAQFQERTQPGKSTQLGQMVAVPVSLVERCYLCPAVRYLATEWAKGLVGRNHALHRTKGDPGSTPGGAAVAQWKSPRFFPRGHRYGARPIYLIECARRAASASDLVTASGPYSNRAKPKRLRIFMSRLPRRGVAAQSSTRMSNQAWRGNPV